MSRTYWNVYVKNQSDEWELDELLAYPNQTLSLPELSTQSKMKNVEGDNIFFTPSTKYTREPITFIWNEDDDESIRPIVENYFRNNTLIKIETHNANYTFIGKFIQFKPDWLTGKVDTFDIEAVFEIMG